MLADYSFPFTYAKSLIACCFTGKLAVKVNRLQKELQRSRVNAHDRQTYKVKDLNREDSKYWLCIKIIELLGNGKPESNKRIAKTLKALEDQRTQVLEELEPRRPKRYRTLSKIQNFVLSRLQRQLEKDYFQLENLINDLVRSVRNSEPSPTVFEELLDRIKQEIDRNSAKISPSRLKFIYKLEDLIKAVFLNNLSGSEGIEANRQKINFLEDLLGQKEVLTEAFKKILVQNQENQQKLNTQSERITRLNREADEREAEINDFRQQIEDLTADIGNLEEKYKKEKILDDLEVDPFNSLKEMLINKKLLKGRYIGNLSDPKTKYHSSPTCPDWKSLVLEYIFMEHEERKIESSESPEIFLTAELEECSKCSSSKNRVK